jgi:hypothetical protein
LERFDQVVQAAKNLIFSDKKPAIALGHLIWNVLARVIAIKVGDRLRKSDSVEVKNAAAV